MVANSFPCTCTHSFVNHVPRIHVITNDRSLICGIYACRCESFEPDNLRYLEKKSGSAE